MSKPFLVDGRAVMNYILIESVTAFRIPFPLTSGRNMTSAKIQTKEEADGRCHENDDDEKGKITQGRSFLFEPQSKRHHDQNLSISLTNMRVACVFPASLSKC